MRKIQIESAERLVEVIYYLTKRGAQFQVVDNGTVYEIRLIDFQGGY